MLKVLGFVPLVLATILSVGCGSTSQSVTGPTSTKCPVSATADPSSFASDGGSGTLAVSTNRECQWNASVSGAWIELGSTSGQGGGRIAFQVGRNQDPNPRDGTITVSDQQVTIRQEPAPCTFVVSPTTDMASAAGERRTITVSASSRLCTWTARSDTDWLVVIDGMQSTGSGQVVYDARPTDGPPRTGSLTIAGQTVTVHQGEGCRATIAPVGQSVPAAGGQIAVSVAVAAGCPWSAHSESPWIEVTSGTSGSGPGSVTLTVAATDGPPRTGTVRIAGHAFTVTQGAGCSYTVVPESREVSSSGGSASFDVRAGQGCAWSAASNAAWLTIASGGSGSGPGSVTVNVAGSSGPARSGTLTIAGHTVTITQGSGCVFSLSAATSPEIPAGGGAATVQVSTAGGCTWSATSAAAWVTITSGSGGSGPGEVGFSVAPNAGPARSATLTIAGHTYTVVQAAGCTYTVNPTSASLAAGGGSGSVAVNAGEGCGWSATGGESWLTITGGSSGAGPGSVSYSVAPNAITNTPTAPRSTTLTIAGQPFVVSQAGCTYALSAAEASVGSGPAVVTVSVIAEDGCTWSVSIAPQNAWVTIASGGSGAGNAVVTFNVEGNPGGVPRTAVINVAGQSFTITQQGQ